MKSKVSKKYLSILLAILLMFSFAQAVFADYHTGATGSISWIDGSGEIYVKQPNLVATSGGGYNGVSNLVNGWHIADSGNNLYCFMITRDGSVVGNGGGIVSYCIEPGIAWPQNSYVNQQQMWAQGSGYIDYVIGRQTSDAGAKLTKDELITILSYVMGNGYNGRFTSTDQFQNAGMYDTYGKIVATQVLVWECIVGERTADFEHITPAGYGKVSDCMNGCAVESQARSHYAQIEKKVKAALKCPSFSTWDETQTDDNTYQLVKDGDVYTLSLTDTNEVISSYDIQINVPGLSAEVNGNTITFTSSVPIDEDVKITFKTEGAASSVLVLTHDGTFSQSNSNQDQIISMGAPTYEAKSYLYLASTQGEVKISKTSANPDCTLDNPNYTLAGAVYGVYTEGDVAAGTVSNQIGTITTDENGQGSIVEGLEPGQTYYVQEISAPKGYLIDDKVYQVTPNGSGSAAAVVESVEKPINDPLTITITKQTVNPVANTTSLAGTQFTIQYYAIDPDTEQTAESLAAVTADRTWIIETKEQTDGNQTVCMTQLTEQYLVSGSDELYFSDGGNETMPVGWFTIQETKAADGYILDSGTITIGGQQIATGNATIVGKVGYDGTITPEYLDITQEATVTNQQILGNVNIVKLDDQDETHQVAGAIFELYQDTNEDGVLDDGEPLFDSLIDNGDGTYSYRELPQGYYILVESQAPYHFEIIDNNWPVVIAEDGDTINFTIENCHLYGDAFFTDPDVSKEYRWDVSISADTGEHINPYLWIAIVLSIACLCGALTLPKYAKNKEKRIKDATPIIWILMLAVLLSSVTVPAYASTTGEDTQTVTIEFESYNREDEASVIAWLNANGYSDYTIDSITYNVVDETTGQTNVVVVTNLISKEEAEAYLTDENGLTATLNDIVWKEVKRVRVSAWKDYENAGDAPRTMGTKVKIGDREFDVVLKLTSLTEQPGHKVHDVVFEGRFPVDFDEIKLADGTVVNISSSSPCFEGYQTKILELQQVEEPDKYKITSGKWTGKTEEIDGVTYRIAEYYGTYTEDGKYFHAIYEEDVNGPYGTIYEAEIHYGNGVEEGKTLYKVKATATVKVAYGDQDKETKTRSLTPGTIAIGGGILVLLALLFILLRRKKNSDDAKKYNDIQSGKKK